MGLLNKEEMLQHIDDPLMKQQMVRLLDRAEGVLRNYEIKATDFMTPYQIKLGMEILKGVDGIGALASGGYPGAERQVLVIYPDYYGEDQVSIPLRALEARGNTQFNQVSHRDYLGSLLGLGIKREKVGDILLHGEGNQHFCHMIVLEELKEYIQFNLEKVGRLSISLKEISLEGIKPQEVHYQEGSATVASLRLDAVISQGFKISRADAQTLVSRELITVNWEPIQRAAYHIAPGDIISVRGKGRLEILAIDGNTRSGRIRITYRKPK